MFYFVVWCFSLYSHAEKFILKMHPVSEELRFRPRRWRQPRLRGGARMCWQYVGKRSFNVAKSLTKFGTCFWNKVILIIYCFSTFRFNRCNERRSVVQRLEREREGGRKMAIIGGCWGAPKREVEHLAELASSEFALFRRSKFIFNETLMTVKAYRIWKARTATFRRVVNDVLVVRSHQS